MEAKGTEERVSMESGNIILFFLFFFRFLVYFLLFLFFWIFECNFCFFLFFGCGNYNLYIYFLFTLFFYFIDLLQSTEEEEYRPISNVLVDAREEERVNDILDNPTINESYNRYTHDMSSNEGNYFFKIIEYIELYLTNFTIFKKNVFYLCHQ